MIKLIAGTNTVGKSRYLEQLYLNNQNSVSYIGYDDDSIRIRPVCRNITVEDNSDSRILVISELLSRCCDCILLDEIDAYVHPADKHIVYSILRDISQTAAIVAATHDVQFTSYGDSFCTVDWQGDKSHLISLTEEEYRKLV